LGASPKIEIGILVDGLIGIHESKYSRANSGLGERMVLKIHGALTGMASADGDIQSKTGLDAGMLLQSFKENVEKVGKPDQRSLGVSTLKDQLFFVLHPRDGAVREKHHRDLYGFLKWNGP
jgi:hypothetical protein